MLTSKGAAPSVRAALEGVKGAIVLDDRTIRFDLKEPTDDAIFSIAELPVFSRKWGAGPDGKPKPFDEVDHRVPDHDRPVHDRVHRLRPRHRVRAQSRLLGARPRRAPGPVQLRPDRLSAVSPTAR